MYSSWMLAGAVAGLTMVPPAGLVQNPRPAPPQPPVERPGAERPPAIGSSADVEFVRQATEGGRKEIDLAKLAVTKSENVEVKLFAQRLIDDHGTANQELMDLVGAAATTPPKAGAPASAALADLSAADFDRAFMSAMVTDHQQDVALFDQEAAHGTSEPLRRWAALKLPTLREHLQMATALQSKIGGRPARQ